MNAENIGYLYSREELKVLVLILGLDGLPGVDLPELDEAAYRSAFADLAEAGIITPAGEIAGVERLTTLLLMNAARCQRGFRLESGGRSVLIWRGSTMFLLGVVPAHGGCVLIPLQALTNVREALPAQFAHSAPPFVLYDVAAPGAPLREAADSDGLRALLRWVCDALDTAGPLPPRN